MTTSETTYVWSTSIGPSYRCTDQDGNEIMQVHLDRRTPRWRVSYPSGGSNIHSGIDGARREAEKHMASLGDDRPLTFMRG